MISPCIGICQIDSDLNICKGCYRTLLEIEEWYFATAEEKEKILDTLETRRRQ
jgi:predicted Fe-S protein YdhL (DUF1289 family)